MKNEIQEVKETLTEAMKHKNDVVLKQEINDFEQALKLVIDNKIEGIKKEIECNATKLDASSAVWSEVVTKHVETKFESVSKNITAVQNVLDETKKKAQEEKERENRANSIIIYRVKEALLKYDGLSHDSFV